MASFGMKVNGQTLPSVVAANVTGAQAAANTAMLAISALHGVIGLVMTYSVEVDNGAAVITTFQCVCPARVAPAVAVKV